MRARGQGPVWSVRALGSPGAPGPLLASHTLPLCYPWILWAVGSPGAGVGLCWVHKHQSAIQWPCEQGEPSAELDKVSKNKTGPLACCIPPFCRQLLIYANQMHENPKSPGGSKRTGRTQLAEQRMKWTCVPPAAWPLPLPGPPSGPSSPDPCSPAGQRGLGATDPGEGHGNEASRTGPPTGTVPLTPLLTPPPSPSRSGYGCEDRRPRGASSSGGMEAVGDSVVSGNLAPSPWTGYLIPGDLDLLYLSPVTGKMGRTPVLPAGLRGH